MIGKNKKGLRLLLFGLLLIGFFIFINHNIILAQILPPYTLQQSLNTDWNAENTYVWQDFEYWNAPSSYGWKSSCPPYPVYGWCPYTGTGRIDTMLDFQLQSRVLVYQCMMSPFNQFYPFFAWNQNVTYPDGDPINDKNVISFNIKMEFGIEYFDQWEVQIYVMSREGNQVNLIYRPVGECESGPEFRNGIQGDIFQGELDPPGYVYKIGRQYQDGTWHLVIRDLDRDIDLTDDGERNYSDGYGKHPVIGDAGDSAILSIMLKGHRLMVDNIAFHKSLDTIINHPPKLQKIGPQFAQLFVPYAYIISAYDRDDVDNTTDDLYEFIATIGGYGSQGIETSNMIYRIKEDPNNAGYYIPCDRTDTLCEKRKVMLYFTPQVFEDLIITVRVVDPGGLSDIETFPLSVVNYEVVSHPPYLEEIENDVYLIGSNEGNFEKEFLCYDQDLEDNPGTADVPGNIVYTAMIDGQQLYQYGPWQEPLIPDPHRPVIKFSPRFEGLHTIALIATDNRGLSAVTEFNIIVTNSGTWLNHPPILCEDIDSPQIARAGEMFTIPIEFFDPDQEPVYYSCNIGSITEIKTDWQLGSTPDSSAGVTTGDDKYGRYVSGAIFNFMSHWPGIYNIEIAAYDIRGGYSIVNFLLDVQPWWTY